MRTMSKQQQLETMATDKVIKKREGREAPKKQDGASKVPGQAIAKQETQEKDETIPEGNQNRQPKIHEVVQIDENDRSKLPILIIRTQLRLRRALNDIDGSAFLHPDLYIQRKKEVLESQNMKFKAIASETDNMLDQLRDMCTNCMTKKMRRQRHEYREKFIEMKKSALEESRKIEKLLKNNKHFENMLEKAKQRKIYRAEFKIGS